MIIISICTLQRAGSLRSLRTAWTQTGLLQSDSISQSKLNENIETANPLSIYLWKTKLFNNNTSIKKSELRLFFPIQSHHY